MKTSIHGNFADTWVWSNDTATEGVDTCAWHRISGYKEEALNNMNVYYNLISSMSVRLQACGCIPFIAVGYWTAEHVWV